ncbi:MAG: NADP oxidoreductase, partial [Pseudomonadales bacterium]
KVKNVYILGRRGPAQAAFTPPEIKEMGEFADADVTVPAAEAELDAASQQALDAGDDKNAVKNVEKIREYAARQIEGKSRLLTIRFLVSPTELLGEGGKVSAIKLVKNELVESEDGSIRPRTTDVEETIPVGLVFRSVGYKGNPLPGLPHHESWGTILNEAGRVVDDANAQVTGLYTAGWIKRGPTGVIGTNKTCAQETVACMVEDLAAGNINQPEDPSVAGAAALVAARKPDAISYHEWLKIDASEVSKGEAQGRPRVKLVSVAEMIEVAKG